MRMLCYKCSHPWNHKGVFTEGKIYVTCPNCMRKIRVDKSLIEDSSEQRLLTSLPKKRVITTSFPLKLPTTTSFERIILDGEMEVLVERKIAKQFKEAPEELEEEIEFVIDGKERDGMSVMVYDLDIKILPAKTPLEIMEHQIAYSKWK